MTINANLVERTLADLRDCLPSDRPFIALHEPHFQGNEWKYVKECLDTGWVSTAGQYVGKFESALQEYTGAKRAVAVVNGTAALHVCLLMAGVEAGEEVILPSLTFIATANAVHYCGAIPHFVDVEPKTLGMDVGKLAEYLERATIRRDNGSYNKVTGRRIRAVVPMHTFGHPVDLDPLAEVCEKYSIELVEDAAESLGSFYKGKHTGRYGRIAALSFNGNKIITTGGGGAILTDDDELADTVKHLTTTAKIPHKWAFFHDKIGYNYRMPNLNAALGCAQLERLPTFLEHKRLISEKYRKVFSGYSDIRFLEEPEHSRSNYWLNAIILTERDEALHEKLLEATNGAGIMTRPIWHPMHRLPMYKDCPRMDLSVTESMERRVINIPSSAGLGETIDE